MNPENMPVVSTHFTNDVSYTKQEYINAFYVPVKIITLKPTVLVFGIVEETRPPREKRLDFDKQAAETFELHILMPFYHAGLVLPIKSKKKKQIVTIGHLQQ